MAKRLAVDNTRRELTAEYEATMRQRSDEFEAARAKLEKALQDAAEYNSMTTRKTSERIAKATGEAMPKAAIATAMASSKSGRLGIC